MSKQPSLTDVERANLVAYLDGELDPPSARALEVKLNLDPGARAEADTLRRTWQLLDHLPKPTPSATFTSRTLERLSAPHPARAPFLVGRGWRRWAFGLGWAAAVLVAGVAGFASGRWMSQRPPAEAPQAVPSEEAPSAKERVTVNASIRERQWVELLPRAEREKVEMAQGPEREALIRELRQRQRERSQEWQAALRHWPELIKAPPNRLADFPYGVQLYVNDYLRPLLGSWEEQRLKNLEGKPRLAWALVAMADRHPVVLPGPVKGPAHLKDLPADVRKALEKLDPATRARLRDAEGTWPDFAIWVEAAASAKGIKLPRQLGPSRPKDFGAQVLQFINRRLTADEQKQLQAAEGHWPLYPRVLLQLAAKHGLKVPGEGARFNLPGPAPYWERFRAKLGAR